MKKLMNVLVALMIIGVTSVYAAEEKTAIFEVSGNCGMCEKTIEKAASTVEGVSKVDWDVKAKKITVVFDDSKTSLDAIHNAIANVGYDTDKVKAKDEVYNNLHGCCKYDRKSCEKKCCDSKKK